MTFPPITHLERTEFAERVANPRPPLPSSANSNASSAPARSSANARAAPWSTPGTRNSTAPPASTPSPERMPRNTCDPAQPIRTHHAMHQPRAKDKPVIRW